uniref:HMG box domain-containing protein n=1 Tax=Romanomermis culicivorax TaxID=13658 RepID=A0A915INF3_ROMCU
MSRCQKPKKNQINGFALFRRDVQFEMKQKRTYITDAELNDLTAQRWENLDETQRSEWKMRAKQVKMKGRAEKVAATVENHNRRQVSNGNVDDDDFDWDEDDQISVARKSSDSLTAGCGLRRAKSFNDAPVNGLPPFIFRHNAGVAVALSKAKPPPVVQPQNVTLEPTPGPLSPITGLPPTSINSFKQQPLTTSSSGVGRGRGPVLVESPPAPFSGPQTVKKTTERSVCGESYLRQINELEIQTNPHKRRQCSRMNLFSSFTWQYESNKESNFCFFGRFDSISDRVQFYLLEC